MDSPSSKRNADTKRICILSARNPLSDTRALQEARSLSGAGYRVLLLGFDDSLIPGSGSITKPDVNETFEVVCLARDRIVRFQNWGQPHMWRPVRIAANLSREWLLRHSKKTIYRQLFHSRSQANYATAYKPDLIQANDLYTLATAAEVAEKTGAVLAYDAYECFDGYFSDRKTQELVTKIEQTFLRKVRLITSPEKWGCDDLFERYGTTAQRVTLLNGVSMIPDKITPCEVHQPIRLLSQASLRPGGNEELLIKAMVHLRGKALLTIQGGGDKNTEKRLHQLALDLQVNDIVSFTGRFAPDKAVQIAIDHDIGVNPIGPNNPNHDHGRGHRFFVFLAAGLALGTAPLASIRNWPEFDKFGFLIDTTDPKRCAASLEKVIAQPEVIFKKKQHALHCAPHYYWENAVKDYIAAIDALLTKPV